MIGPSQFPDRDQGRRRGGRDARYRRHSRPRDAARSHPCLRGRASPRDRRPDPYALAAFALLDVQLIDAGRDRRQRPAVNNVIPWVCRTSFSGRPGGISARPYSSSPSTPSAAPLKAQPELLCGLRHAAELLRSRVDRGPAGAEMKLLAISVRLDLVEPILTGAGSLAQGRSQDSMKAGNGASHPSEGEATEEARSERRNATAHMGSHIEAPLLL
jgi:hypothetical protein